MCVCACASVVCVYVCVSLCVCVCACMCMHTHTMCVPGKVNQAKSLLNQIADLGRNRHRFAYLDSKSVSKCHLN